MDNLYLDGLRKGSGIYFVDPGNILEWKFGYVRKRITKRSERKSSDGKYITKVRKTFLIIAEHIKPSHDETKYLIEYTIFNNKAVLERVLEEDLSEALIKELGEIRVPIVFHSNKLEFHIKWYKMLLRRLNLIEGYQASYKSLASTLRDIVDTMRYCLMTIQESK